MKKIMMTLAAVCVAATMNAQGYIGGNLGFSSYSDKSNPAAENTITRFYIAPEIGYKLDDKMAVGVALGFTTKNDKTENTTVDPKTSTELKSTKFNLKPYLRYQVLTFGKANIFVDGGLNFALESAKDMKPAMDFGLFVTPGISFDVNEKWSIVAKLNDVFAFGYHKDMVADVDNAPDPATRINADFSTGGFTSGSLTFGVYYNF